MKYSQLQLNLPYPGIHSVVLRNLQSGRQGEERIWNMLAASMSCHSVHQRSPIPFVIKGINVLSPISTLAKEKKQKLLSIIAVIYPEVPKNADCQGLIRVRSGSQDTVNSHNLCLHLAPCRQAKAKGPGPSLCNSTRSLLCGLLPLA